MSIINRLANPFRAMRHRAARSANPRAHGREENPMGIYDPPEPNVSVLPPEAKRVWDAAFEEAMKSYGDRGIAESTAWRKVRLSWQAGAEKLWRSCSGGSCVPWPASQQLPPPASDLVALGVMIEYGYIDRDGVLKVWATDREKPPVLYWDSGRKALYSFPKLPYYECAKFDPNLHAQAANVYETWTKRKPACGVREITIPKTRIKCIGAADTISYRSDKWYDRQQDPRVPGAQEYIHKHWHGVWLWLDNEDDPSVIMIQGGELDLHAKGIIH